MINTDPFFDVIDFQVWQCHWTISFFGKFFPFFLFFSHFSHSEGFLLIFDLLFYIIFVTFGDFNISTGIVPNDKKTSHQCHSTLLGKQVRECIIHVGGTRCVPSSTGNIMNIQARIMLTVECIRTCFFFYFCCMCEYNNK